MPVRDRPLALDVLRAQRGRERSSTSSASPPPGKGSSAIRRPPTAARPSPRAACEPFGADLYPRLKRACDEYFVLPHRGTRFGLQAGARVESVLASLPPEARWRYDWRPEPGSPEERLTTEFLVARDWLEGES